MSYRVEGDYVEAFNCQLSALAAAAPWLAPGLRLGPGGRM